MNSDYHVSVLLHESISLLKIKKNAWYIDGTLGGGGHTQEILKQGGNVLAVDLDEDALIHARKKFKRTNTKLKLVKGNFKDLDIIIKKNGVADIAGILLDLGVSSYQLETPDRGFSFNKIGRLDMRMDQNISVSAFDLVNGLTEKELAELFWKFGGEHFSRSIAKRIVDARRKKRIETTDELARIILSVRYRSKSDRTHPATRVFQALRIVVNDEIHSLRAVLPKAVNVLRPSGRLVIISFHSLEDRIVKQEFAAFEQRGLGEIITKKPILPTDEEVSRNQRSRSAKLRAFEKN